MKMRLAYSAVLCLAVSLARAEVRLPSIFSDHMVLQRGARVPVWGWADPGEQVTISVAGQTRKTQTGSDGKWMVRLAPLKAGQPLRLVVQGKNKLAVEDVLVGEVWLCSGQSNMVLHVSAAQNFEAERAAATSGGIRTFIVAQNYAKEPQADVKGEWVTASPETVGRFSAVAYFFARELHKDLGVPVGLVNASIGGTAIELWISAEAQRKSPALKPAMEAVDRANAEFDAAGASAKYQAALAKWKAGSAETRGKKRTPERPPADPVALHIRKYGVGMLFNGMIAPLIPFAVRGGLWYQGEANSMPGRAEYYQYQLPLLMEDWRARWGQADFPFAWVQLPNFNGPGRNWPLVREAMLKALRVPHTGMAITIDIGDPDNIHPTNKQDVGKRLALWALGDVYGRMVETSGPLPAGHKSGNGEVTVSFTHTGGGLVAKGGALQGFSIAGPDKKWVSAAARIAGDSVVVSNPEVKNPVAVRYAWANNPACNLYNGAGLPASPFRTDDWPE